MIKLRGFLKPYLMECIVGPTFKLTEAVLELLLPTIMAFIVNNGVQKNDTDYILKYGMLMLAMAILGFGCSCVCQYLAARASQGVGTDLRNSLFAHIGTLSAAQLDRFGASSLASRLVNDVNNLQLAVAMLIRIVIRAPFICIGSVIMAMFLNMKLAVVLLALIPLFALLLVAIFKLSAPMYTAVLKILDRLTSKVRQNLSGVRVIRAFSMTERERSEFCDINTEYTRELNRVGKVSALLSPITTVLVNFAIIAVLYRSAGMIKSDGFLLGDIVAFVNYASQILLAMIVISKEIHTFTRAAASANRVREVLNTTNNLPHGDKIPEKSENAIEFENVSFGYNDGADMVLKDVSFKIKSGERVGIIGGTGSGKTTLVSLIMYDYAAADGKVKLMGQEVSEISEQKLSEIISCVPQKAALITGTIAENISMGRDITKEEIARACKIAQIDDFIQTLPEKYDSQVLRDGKNFSGGQRQRLSIARAAAKKSDILILDDSASALDFATEKRLREAIEASFEDMTVIIISQRVSSIRHCDKILVLDDGELAGQGTHRQLFKSCAPYRDICLHQLSDKELEVLSHE